MTTSTDLSPRIYVASLSDYNAGTLHGVWIDLTEVDDMDELWEKVNAMLAASPEFKAFPLGGPAEEWAIHDYEGFGGYRLHEYESLEKVLKAAKFLEEHGEAGAAWLGYDSTKIDEDDLDEAFSESYAGTWDSEREYAEILIGDIGLPGIGPVKVNIGPDWRPNEVDVLEALSSYLDWDALTRWALEDCWTETLSDHTVAVFRSY